MNNDVVFKIAGFCDADSRRALGHLPRPLRRNAGFEQKLQDIHRQFHIHDPISLWGGCQVWHIRLNKKMFAAADLPVSAGKRTDKRRHIGVRTKDSRAGNIGDHYSVTNCDPLLFTTTEEIRYTYQSMNAVLFSGKWTVTWPRRGDMADGEVVGLRKLGYEFYQEHLAPHVKYRPWHSGPYRAHECDSKKRNEI
jgi:hypothetical protein